MEILFIVGRVLFALLFLGSAFGHFAQTEAMTQYAQYKGVPAAKASVLLSGVMLAFGAISIALGIYPVVGALVLVAFLLPTAVLMHNFWKESDAQAKQMEMIAYNKDIALAGAALVIAYVFATVENLPFVLFS